MELHTTILVSCQTRGFHVQSYVNFEILKISRYAIYRDYQTLPRIYFNGHFCPFIHNGLIRMNQALYVICVLCFHSLSGI